MNELPLGEEINEKEIFFFPEKKMQKKVHNDANNEISNICDQIAKRIFLVNFLLDLCNLASLCVCHIKKKSVKSFPASKHDSISRKKLFKLTGGWA